jgi:hypothetical protein
LVNLDQIEPFFSDLSSCKGQSQNISQAVEKFGGRVHVFSGEARQVIALAMLFLSAPKANNDFMSRSTDTVGSPFSILATLD